jgi:TRAP-type C4-dicarboxylate transport system permease small subunit
VSGADIRDRGLERSAIDRVLRKIETAAAIVGGVMMLTAMVLTSLDAVLRYVFNWPLSFNFYLTENYLMVGLMTLPLAWGFRAGGYIRVMALAHVLPARPRGLLLRTGLCAGAIYIAALAWLSGAWFWEVYQRGDVRMGVIDWPVAWSLVWVPIGLGLFAIRLLAMSFGPAENLHYEHDDTGGHPP